MIHFVVHEKGDGVGVVVARPDGRHDFAEARAKSRRVEVARCEQAHLAEQRRIRNETVALQHDVGAPNDA